VFECIHTLKHTQTHTHTKQDETRQGAPETYTCTHMHVYVCTYAHKQDVTCQGAPETYACTHMHVYVCTYAHKQDVIRQGAPEIAAFKNLEDRIPKDAFTDVRSDLAVQACDNPKGVNMVSFSLPQTWQRGDDGRAYHVCVRCFKLPYANANDRGEKDLEEKAWEQCELNLNTHRIAESVCGRVKAINLDAFARHGMNTLMVQSWGERMVVAVQLVSSRPLQEVGAFMRVCM
jgi:hypothetical protein